MSVTARQSTARTIMVGPVLDSAGAAVTNAVVGDFKISKNGGIPASLNASATLTHRHTGHYSLALTASDYDTVGSAQVTLDKTTDACPEKDITVIEEAVYDALFVASATGMLPANVIQLLGTAWLTPGTAGTPDVNVKLWNALTTVALPLVPTTAGRTLDVSAGGEAGVDWANVGTPGSTVNLSATTTNLVNTATTLTNLPAITANWLTAAGIAADAITAAKVAADVTTEIQSGLATAAELAKVPKSDSTVTWNATALASIQTEAEDAIVAHRLDELLNADSDIDGAAPPTVGSVFHELMSKTAGSFTFDQTTDSCEALRDRGDAAWTTATGFSTHTAADVWAAATRTLTAGTNIQLPSNGLANVTAWTVAITGNITGNLSGSVGSVTGAVGSVTGAVGSVTGAVGSIASGGITAASFGAGAIDAAAIAADAIGTSEFSTAAANKIADIVLRRTMTSVEASSFGETLDLSSLYGSVQMQQEASVSGSTLSVKRVDGSTALGTKTLGTTAGVDPVTSVT